MDLVLEIELIDSFSMHEVFLLCKHKLAYSSEAQFNINELSQT